MTPKQHKQRFTALHNLPCCQCGATPIQVAHSNFGEHGKGKGIKAYDEYTIPLCHECHAKFDQYDMNMSRAESKEWFLEKLEFVNEVLNGKDREPAF